MKLRVRTLFALTAAFAASTGCGGKLNRLATPKQPPVATLIVTRLSTPSADSAAFELKWSATVARGRIDHYLVAIDPRSLAASDPAWQATRETRRTFGFAAATPVQHRVALRAVAATGEQSDPVWRTLELPNLPPTVQILQPIPSALLYQIVPPNFHIAWTGYEPDGRHPVKYKFKLFKDTDSIFGIPSNGTTNQFDYARGHPDSVRSFYAPAFAGWDSVGGDTTGTDYANRVPTSRYLFFLAGFDEAGSYNSGLWTLTTNVLQMVVAVPGTVGPILTMFDEYFNYTYASGGFHNDLAHTVDAQVPGGIPLSFHWSAQAPAGGTMCWYRWVIDLADLNDETPRSDENTDWYHWSAKSLQTTQAVIGPFNPPAGGRQVHLLYIEAQDCNGNLSLGIVRFIVTPRQFSDEYSLLIVDDTRLQPDQTVVPPDPAHPDSIDRPAGSWPTAAELDTFLVARGGVRYRMTPDGTLSMPGIFAGYHFDTVSTRFMPGNVFPIALLEQYRHVIWITEQNAATGNNPVLGKGMLRLMSEPGMTNSLAAYIKQGGQVWLAGGGAGSAATLPWNQLQNDFLPPPGVVKFSSTALPGRPPELQLGRFMFDIAHWESGFYVSTSQFPALRSPSAGGWPGAPDYGSLPAQLGNKTAANDPVPPFRSPSGFFSAAQTHSVEYLSEPNSILGGPVPPGTLLDTLFAAQGVPLPPSPPNPYLPACMTYYHGADSGGLLLSGFDLWTYTRPDLIALADFVLQQVWGMSRDPVARPATNPRIAGRPRGL